jgi:hypothetical protein
MLFSPNSIVDGSPIAGPSPIADDSPIANVDNSFLPIQNEVFNNYIK